MHYDELEKLKDPVVLREIETSTHMDPGDYALQNTHRSHELPVRAIAEQIRCRQKARKKLPALSKKPLLYEPRALEQCSSEITARYKASLITASSIIDLTGGLGIDTLYFADICEKTHYCEQDPTLCALFSYNNSVVQKPIAVHSGDGIAVLNTFDNNSLDYIYIDPSRRDSSRRYVALEKCTPNVAEHIDLFFQKGHTVLIKAAPAQDITAAAKLLPFLDTCIVVSVNNECKELLLLCRKKHCHGQPFTIKAVLLDIRTENIQEFSSPANQIPVKKVGGAIGPYLYEPDAAIIKAGLSPLIASQWNVKFVNKSVDYVTGQRLEPTFPGRKYFVHAVIPWKKKTVQQYLHDHGIRAASVARRDFKLSPEQIKKMFSLKEGNAHTLVCTVDNAGKPICVHCRLLRSEH